MNAPHDGSARPLRRVCVYCASSTQADPEHRRAAACLGRELARAGIELVYGGGAVGSMGALADAALAEGGRVVGIIPRFMQDLEWGHAGLQALHVVDDMHQRKRRMLEQVDGIVALPGGCGTLEELLEAITWKRLGLLNAPILVVNVRGFYDPLQELLQRCIHERFMHHRHAELWSLVERPEDVLPALRTTPPWASDARSFATL